MSSHQNKNQKENNQPRIVAARTETGFSGPIPPPQILEGYEKIHPGLANRIMVMAEEQSANRRKNEERIVVTSTRNETLGLVFSFILGFILIVGAIFLLYCGKTITGLVALVPPVLLVSISSITSILRFFYTRKS